MQRKVLSIFICALIITSVSASIAQNVGQSNPEPTSGGSSGLADSPWPMFRQNLNHTGLSPYDTSGNNGQLKWSFKTTGNDYIDRSSPAIDSNGSIYIGSTDPSASSGYLYAIKPDGTEKWSFTSGNNFHITHSSPAISSDGTIYIGSDDHKLYAITPDGIEKWNFMTGERIWSSPAISSDGTIYIGSNDNNLYAINHDGTEEWIFPTSNSVESSPTIGSDGTIYVGSNDNNLYAINPDGSEKWKYSTGSYVCFKSPAIGTDGTIYIASSDGLYALNPDGTEKWNHGVGDSARSAAIGSDGTIYFSSETEKIHAIYPNGTEKWRFPLGSAGDSIPTIGSDGTVYVGSDYNNLYAINSDGTERWHFITGDSVESSPAIDSDGTIYVGSNEGKLYAIGNPGLGVDITSHFSELNSAAQSSITVHVTDGTNPIQGATVNLGSDNGGMFNPQSGITDANGDFKSIFNAPTVTTQIICRITAQASKAGYNDGSGYVDVTINPIPWPMFRQNLNHTGQSPYDTSSNPGKLKWDFMTGGRVISSPAIGSDGTIYVGSYDHKLYAINPDGTEKWNFITGSEVFSSPSIDSDGTIYIGSFDNNLYAINVDGSEKWHFTTGYPVRSSPIIGSDGTIYFGSDDNKLYAINPDGTEKWSLTTGFWVRASPAIGLDGTIYITSCDQKLYAINPDGTEKWNFMTGASIHSSPIIGFDGTIYVGSSDGKLYAINQDGTEKWNFTTGGVVYSSPAIGSDWTIYVGSFDNKLYAIDPDGTEKWNLIIGDDIHTSPAVGSDGTIYVGSDDDILHAINPDGTEKWIFITGNEVFSSPAIDIDGTIYIGSYDNKLYAIGTLIPDITVEKIADMIYATPGDTINYTIFFNNTPILDLVNGLVHQQLTFENSHQENPNFKLDRSKIVYSSYEDGGSQRDIWIMDSDGSNNQQLTFENADQVLPSFSPDGSKIVYHSFEALDGDEDIWIMDADGSNHQQLTDVSYEQYPRFSPNGSKIVYMSQEDGGFDYDIWIMDIDGSNHQQLTFENVEQFYPSFSPDGGRIVYSSKEDGGSGLDIWIMNTDGSNRYQLTFENNNQYYPSFSPDGNKIIYSSLEDGGGYVDIWIMNADGSDHQHVTTENTDQMWPIFSPDENKIIYHSKEDGDIYYDIWALVPTSGTIANTVWINDTLPSEVTFITSSAEANRTGDYNWTYYDVGPGEHNFTVTVQVNTGVTNGTILTNYVHLDHTDSLGTLILDSSDTADVLVLAPENQPPIADAGPDQTVNEGDVVQFDGSSSHDPDDTIESYEWDFDSADGLWWDTGAVPDATGPTPTHVFGDNGHYTVTLKVTDDTSETDTDECIVTINNVAPSITLLRTYPDDEGSRVTFEAEALDPGSDDVTYSWELEYGPTIENTFYNNGVSPEPVYDPASNEVKSPSGTYPFHTSDVATHIYGDNYDYTIIFTVTDDDGGESTYTTTVTVDNLAPSIMEMNIPSQVDEGSSALFEVLASDQGSDDLTFTWDFEMGPTITNVHYNDGGGPDPCPSPWGDYPFEAWDAVNHAYCDDGMYTLSISIEDDDGGITTYSTDIPVRNVAPTIETVTVLGGDEGSVTTFSSTATDSGSDDLIFTWDWGDGTLDTKNIHYNDGLGPDPPRSPLGNYPFTTTDTVSHIYGDDGDYTITLTVEDDDGGKATYTTRVKIDNVAPIINPFGPFTVDEGSSLELTTTSTDPGSDDLTFTWEFDMGPTITNVFYNDGLGADPSPSPWGTYPYSALDSVEHTYGDDGVYPVTLTVSDDDGGMASFTTNITVNNVAPTIATIEAYMYVNFSLRVAGEKYHSVGIHLYEDDVEIWNAQVTRQPGSPNAQAATLSGYSINFGSSYRAIVDYLPNDPRVNGNVWGGNPVWIILEFQDGTTERLHHTFNVRQSYWDSDHWNHIDPWEVDLTGIIYRHNITFEATASDPGSDDLIFTWDFGDGGTAGPNTYFNNDVNPDPYPSPEINPMNASDTVLHAYMSSGTYTVTLTVMDDDGGIATATFIIVLPG